MPSIINAATSGGLISTADTSGVLQLQTASTTALTITAAQRIGVGTASPSERLDNRGAAVFSGDNATGTNAFGTASGILLSTASDNSAARVTAVSNGANNVNLVLRSLSAGSGVSALTLNPNGAVALNGAVTTATGTGITFPATQSASSDANTLDDYEEGTWTPSVGGNATYSTDNKASYVKIGKMVTVNFDLIIAALGTGSTTTITNLPFLSSNDGFPRTGCVSYYAGLTISPIFIAFYLSNNNTTAVFVWNTVGGSTIGFNSAALFGNGSRIIGSLTYSASA